MKKHFLCLISFLMFFNVSLAYANTPQQVLHNLEDGNGRFTLGHTTHLNYLEQIQATATKQTPQAAVLTCADSRTPPELVFNQGIGDLFTVRVAGNVVNDDVLASLEYAVQYLGVKLIVVMGHTQCGAVEAACKKVKAGFITQLLAKIKPAVNEAIKDKDNHDCGDQALINEAATDNVENMMREIESRSPIISRALNKGNIDIVGAMQDISSGRVTFIVDDAIPEKRKQ